MGGRDWLETWSARGSAGARGAVGVPVRGVALRERSAFRTPDREPRAEDVVVDVAIGGGPAAGTLDAL